MTPLKDERPSEIKFREAHRNVVLARQAPAMLDALRLIYFAVTTDHDALAVMKGKVKQLCEAALKGTEDI